VISGSLSACDRALSAAEKMGLRATALKVAGAFHSPLMQPAADRLGAALDRVQWQTPRVPVVSNVDAQPHNPSDVASIKRLLVAQLTSPVRWAASVQWLIANVKGQYHELAPGKVLAGLMRRIDRQVSVTTHADP
jgi:[acyl-carrier-protein] S-malonyltransferase